MRQMTFPQLWARITELEEDNEWLCALLIDLRNENVTLRGGLETAWAERDNANMRANYGMAP